MFVSVPNGLKASLVQRINVQDAMSMPIVKMGSVFVMGVITGQGLWENASVSELQIQDSVFQIPANMVDLVSKRQTVTDVSARLTTMEKTVSYPPEQLRLRTKYRTPAQASLVKTEGAVFQKGTDFNVYVPRDLKGQRVRWQQSHIAIPIHACMEENALTAKVDTLVNASAPIEGLIVKWMTVNNVIYTPYVFRELANAE